MQNNFVKNNIDIQYPFPLDLDKESLNALLNFFSAKENNLCFLHGPSGSFKTDLCNYSLKYLNDRVLVFKIKCFEGTTLDDIFLAFFEDLKRYSQQKKISFTKIETNSISTRINTYLSHITQPCLIIFDSLQNIFNKTNTAEKDEIIAYINHLNLMNKFKILLISSAFDNQLFSESNNSVNISTKFYSEEQIYRYLNHFNIQYDKNEIARLLEITGTDIISLRITVNLILTLKISLSKILNEFENKKSSYRDFVIQKLITFIPSGVKNIINVLTLCDIGIPERYLTGQNIVTVEQINYFTEKNILSDEYGFVFVNPFLRNYIKKTIEPFEKIRIHNFWKNFFESQLPLKPNERAIMISRNTMRSQIAFHDSFINSRKQKEPEKEKQKTPPDVSFMSYVNSDLSAWNFTVAKDSQNKDENEKENLTEKKRPIPPKSLQNRNERFEKYALTKEELSLLNMPVDLRKQQEYEAGTKVYKIIEQKNEEILQKKSERTLKVLCEKAQSYEESHDYETALNLYSAALTLNNDKDFYKNEPLIVEKLAFCSKKLNKTTDAIDFYNKLTDIYSSRNNIEKLNAVKLKIAEIYKETYKINYARIIYENFINGKTIANDNIIFISYIELAEIEEDISDSYTAENYYQKAFALLDKTTDISADYLSKAYFKFALLLDDNNRTAEALEYYEKSINTSSVEDTSKSAAYTNIAEIVKEKGNLKQAVDYYKLALKCDLANSNYEGVYYLCLKLAQLAKSIQSENELNWLLKSLSSAKRCSDSLYTANAYIEIGDFYKRSKNYEKSYKAYLLAKRNMLNMNEYRQNEDIIIKRINTVKIKLDNEQISKIEKEVK